MANLYINGQFHKEIQMLVVDLAYPVTWGDTDTVYMFHNKVCFKASARSTVLGDRKGHPVCYWDKVHPALVPPELRVYELILN
jgi:hypothetical protein